MPKRSKKPCGYPRCPELVDFGQRYCEAHAHLSKKRDRDRGTATERGYGWKWQKARKRFLRIHPLCAECEKKGLTVAATVVDHIIPHRGNQKLFWDVSNWQPLCKQCHDRKTAQGG